MRDSNIHTYKLSDNQWYCMDCKAGCLEKKTMLEYQQSQQTDISTTNYREMVFNTVTNIAIPHTFTQEMNKSILVKCRLD